MMIQHETSLPLPLFQKLQENLAAQHWEATNEPYFSASLDFQEDMKMTPTMAIAELAEWVSEMAQKTLPGLSQCGTNSDTAISS